MATLPPLAYDWRTNSAQCLAELQTVCTSIDADSLSPLQIQKCRSILEALSTYLDDFTRITKHTLLKDKKLYDCTSGLKKFDESIRRLWSDKNFRACFMLGNEDLEQNTKYNLPPNVEAWLLESNAADVLVYLNTVNLKSNLLQRVEESDMQTIANFAVEIQKFVSGLDYVLTNAIITKDTTLDDTKTELVKFNPFFKSAMKANLVIEVQGLEQRIDDLYTAIYQTEDAITARSSAKPSPHQSPSQALKSSLKRTPIPSSPSHRPKTPAKDTDPLLGKAESVDRCCEIL